MLAAVKYSPLRWRTAASKPTSDTSDSAAVAARTSPTALVASCTAGELPLRRPSSKAACRRSAMLRVQRRAAADQPPACSMATTCCGRPGRSAVA